MDYQQLLYFRDVVQTGSISKTAEKLFLSRQTISAALGRMEEELGYPLLARGKGGVELTSDGALFYSRIESLFQSGDHLIRDMKEYGRNYRLPLRVGMTPGLEYPAYRALEHWQETHPEINLLIEYVPGKESTRRLTEGSLDVVITLMPNYASPHYISELVAEYPLCLAVHQDHPLSSRTVIEETDLRDVTMLSSTLGYEEMEYRGHKFMPYSPEETPFLFTESRDLLLSWLIHNKGVVFCYQGSLLSHIDCLRLIPLQGGYTFPIFLRTSNHALKKGESDALIRDLKRALTKGLTLK